MSLCFGNADPVGLGRQKEGTRESDRRRKLLCMEIDHDKGKGSKDQRNGAELHARRGERLEPAGEDEKEEG